MQQQIAQHFNVAWLCGGTMQDIADWLQVPPAGLKAFGEEVRPVKLRTVVKGYAPTKTDFLFERRLNDYIYGVVAEHSKSKPSLVFCRRAAVFPVCIAQ